MLVTNRMKTLNFKIDEGCASITSQDKYFDLHNNFYLVDTLHDKEQRSIKLKFKKGTGDWISKSDPEVLTLLFKNVSDVFYQDHNTDYPKEYITQDQFTLDQIGFSYSDNNPMDGVTDNMPREDIPALLMIMVTGKAIKIIGDSVELLA